MIQSAELRLPKIRTMCNMLPIDPSKLCVRKMKKKGETNPKINRITCVTRNLLKT